MVLKEMEKVVDERIRGEVRIIQFTISCEISIRIFAMLIVRVQDVNACK